MIDIDDVSGLDRWKEPTKIKDLDRCAMYFQGSWHGSERCEVDSGDLGVCARQFRHQC
jgi:hypothetical protein